MEKKMSDCACGSGQSYDVCCEPRINGSVPAETAEALLRARYTAHGGISEARWRVVLQGRGCAHGRTGASNCPQGGP